MKIKIKQLIAPIFTILAFVIVYILAPQRFFEALLLMKNFLLEMVQILPGVIIISGLIAIWIPREWIIKSFGSKSGWKGRVFSILLGSVSAGPIYAAFPLCLTLKKKGASIGNIVTIISSWAVIKVPMLLMEIKFLGPKFAGIRYILTVPAILAIAFLTEKLTQKETDSIECGPQSSIKTIQSYAAELPGYNCGACGYVTCIALAEAIFNKQGDLTLCKFSVGNDN